MASPNATTNGRDGRGGAGPQNGDTSAGGPQKKSLREMTKAERRAQQEQQRAAKAANTTTRGQNQSQGGGSGSAPGHAPSNRTSAVTPAADSQRPSTSIASVNRQSTSKETKETAMAQELNAGPRGLRIFEHFNAAKSQTYLKSDIHPSIIQLGLKFSEFIVVGANARCIATLHALKDFIQDYSTPSDKSLSRHLMARISLQIDYLASARPMAVTMENAIRQLKLEISKIDLDMPEQDAKEYLYHWIDNYIMLRILAADQLIQKNAAEKINDGDVLLTYAKSSVVEKVILYARERGKKFSVIVVDSRPMLEGKNLLKILTSLDIPCIYALLPSLPAIMETVTTVLLGAHSIHADGAVYSRAGSALVAALAKDHNVSVLICCETYKFSENMHIDGFTKNELAPQKYLYTEFPSSVSRDKLTLQSDANLHFLGALYDLTPAANITAVVTEVGIIPPKAISSIPASQDDNVRKR